MAIKSGIVDGLDDLIRDLGKFSEDALPALKVASDQAGQLVLARAIARAPERTGNLKRNLKLATFAIKKGKVMTYCNVTVSAKAKYYIPLELGHDIRRNKKKVGTVAARPFLRPAADESRAEVVSILVDAMNKELERLGGKP
jgi:HK97 gp10 family phage protein